MSCQGQNISNAPFCREALIQAFVRQAAIDSFCVGTRAACLARQHRLLLVAEQLKWKLPTVSVEAIGLRN